MSKKYRVFYHYNKQHNKMSVHFRNRCYIVDNIGCFVDMFTKWNKTQPHLVMQGWAEKVIISSDKTAIIE